MSNLPPSPDREDRPTPHDNASPSTPPDATHAAPRTDTDDTASDALDDAVHREMPSAESEPAVKPVVEPGGTATVSAADRVQSRELTPGPVPETAARRPRLIRPLPLAVLGLVGAAIAVGVLTLRGSGEAGTDLFEHLETSAADFRAELVTVDASAAERYVLDAFGWPVEAPTLPELQLVGVGEAGILQTQALDVTMPAFRYDSRDGETLVVFVYDYVLLDGAQGALDLPEPVYARLAETPPVDVRRQSGLSYVTWRVRSVVYTAVTDDEDTAERIARSVSG